MTCLLQCMPALLELFKDEEPHWYEIMCSYESIHLNLFVNFLQNLNKLNLKFQIDMVALLSLFQF